MKNWKKSTLISEDLILKWIYERSTAGWQISSSARNISTKISQKIIWEKSSLSSYFYPEDAKEPENLECSFNLEDEHPDNNILGSIINQYLNELENNVFISIDAGGSKYENSDEKLGGKLYHDTICYVISANTSTEDIINKVINYSYWYSYVGYAVKLKNGNSLDKNLNEIIDDIISVDIVVTDAYDLDGFAIWKSSRVR
jgi:hypothetical protein